MVRIFRKKNWELNPDDLVINSILKMLEKTEGKCPCLHPENDGDLQCPCESYRMRDKCYCGLYVKVNEKNNNKSN